MKLLLDGSKMRESIFYKKFRAIVGVSWSRWIDNPKTKRDSGSEWYCDQDDNFVCSGSVYEPPKLYRKTRRRALRNRLARRTTSRKPKLAKSAVENKL